MKVIYIFFIIFILPLSPLFANRILYAEQYYKLFHLHFYQYPDDTMENLYYLEKALNADFCNPLYALARITNKTEWKHYRDLFKMHVNLKIVEQYLILGSKYDKQVAHFYNQPWKEQNLDSLDIAEQIYKTALYYWGKAKEWSQKAWSLNRIHLEQIQKWEDDNFRIQIGELNYSEIISFHLQRLNKVRNDFLNMNENTY